MMMFAGLDALVGCMSSANAAVVYTALDAMHKPIKSLFLTNGPNDPHWNNRLGNLSTVGDLSAMTLLTPQLRAAARATHTASVGSIGHC